MPLKTYKILICDDDRLTALSTQNSILKYLNLKNFELRYNLDYSGIIKELPKYVKANGKCMTFVVKFPIFSSIIMPLLLLNHYIIV